MSEPVQPPSGTLTLPTLPEEIIEAIIFFLLPEPHDSHKPLNRHLGGYSASNDLCNVRQVCHAFYSAASRWMFRRISIVNRPWRTQSPGHLASINVVDRALLNKLGKQSELAARTKILSLESVFLYIPYGPDTRPSLTMTDLDIFRGMVQLRTLYLRHCLSGIAVALLPTLLALPSLECVIITYLPTGLETIDWTTYCFPSIKQISVQKASRGLEEFLVSLPNLEALSLLSGCYRPGRMDIPWATLRQLELVCDTQNDDVPDGLDVLLESYEKDESNPIPLVELCAISPTKNEILRIVEEFRDIPLQNLILGVNAIFDIEIIKQIVSTFKNLRALSLLRGNWNTETHWGNTKALGKHLVKYGAVIAQLQDLEYLCWNYREYHIETNMSDDEFLAISRAAVEYFGRVCPNLRHFKFMRHKESWLYRIHRRCKEFRDVELLEVQEDDYFQSTSAWQTGEPLWTRN